jgi:hypothetical protein
VQRGIPKRRDLIAATEHPAMVAVDIGGRRQRRCRWIAEVGMKRQRRGCRGLPRIGNGESRH